MGAKQAKLIKLLTSHPSPYFQHISTATLVRKEKIMPLNQKLTTPNHSPAYRRLSPLLFDGKNNLQQCFYDYLTTAPISIRSVPASLIDKLSKFYHFDDAAKIEHSSEALNSLIKQTEKILHITSTHLHNPDITQQTRLAQNSPDCLLYRSSENPDYYYEINENIRLDDIKLDSIERELNNLLTEMGKTYKQLLNTLGFHII